MRPTRSLLALSTVLLAAGTCPLKARADGPTVNHNLGVEPTSGASVIENGQEKKILQTFPQPLAAKLATAAVGGAANGTSKATSRVTFSNGNTDAEADVEIDL